MGQAAGSTPAVTISSITILVHLAEFMWHLFSEEKRQRIEERVRKVVERMRAEKIMLTLSGIGVAEGCYHLAEAERAVPHTWPWRPAAARSDTEAAAHCAGDCSVRLAGCRPAGQP